MTFQLFQEVVLAIDLPAKGLQKGDVATIVEEHPAVDGEKGYTLELFNALGETIAVVTVPEAAIAAMTAQEVLTVRQFSAAS
ncbi:MAG: DUF4926 domain-containing protein [Anaerolineales bacterium]|nr:DUF4926 domain-containing protein [Anaerolineales bacterium]